MESTPTAGKKWCIQIKKKKQNILILKFAASIKQGTLAALCCPSCFTACSTIIKAQLTLFKFFQLKGWTKYQKQSERYYSNTEHSFFIFHILIIKFQFDKAGTNQKPNGCSPRYCVRVCVCVLILLWGLLTLVDPYEDMSPKRKRKKNIVRCEG